MVPDGTIINASLALIFHGPVEATAVAVDSIVRHAKSLVRTAPQLQLTFAARDFTELESEIQRLRTALEQVRGERDLWREWWESSHGEMKDGTASPRQLAIFKRHLAARSIPTPGDTTEAEMNDNKGGGF